MTEEIAWTSTWVGWWVFYKLEPFILHSKRSFRFVEKLQKMGAKVSNRKSPNEDILSSKILYDVNTTWRDSNFVTIVARLMAYTYIILKSMDWWFLDLFHEFIHNTTTIHILLGLTFRPCNASSYRQRTYRYLPFLSSIQQLVLELIQSSIISPVCQFNYIF